MHRNLDPAHSDRLQEWANRTKSIPLITLHGRFEIEVNWPDLSKATPESLATDVASLWFVSLLDNPKKERLARCSNPKCQQFFLRERKPRKELLNGSYCKKCARIASKARTTKTREGRRTDFIARAARALAHDRASGHAERSATWIAGQINRGVRPDMRITGNRITRNRALIDLEAQKQREEQVHTGRN